MRTGATLLVLLLVATLLSLPLGVPTTKAVETPIKHVVVIMEENHTFDNYFGTYPGANGINGSAVVQQSLNSRAPVKPFYISSSELPTDLDHSWQTAHDAYDNGKMDRFVAAEGSNLTMGYFDYHQIPYYWDYASQFVLMDNYYSSVMGPSLPNHLYLIAGQSGTLTENARYGTINYTSSNIHNGIFEFKSVTDELDAAQVSWKYYAGGYQYLNNWNPLPAFASFQHNSTKLARLAATEQFARDVNNGNLPAVSWIMPAADDLSEHPPYNVTTGQMETVKQINTLMKSPYWNSTAIFLTWDDYGGWYDHVPPPQTFENRTPVLGFGFRVPCIILSPYAKQGFVDHTQADHSSILKFIETTFSLPSLAPRDTNANNLLEAFSFDKSPRPPLALPGPFIANQYPLKPMSNGTLVPIKGPPPGQTLANVAIERVPIVPSRPRVGDMVSASFLVRNVGNAPAHDVTVSLYLNDSTHNYQHLETTQPFGLSVGESKSLSFASLVEATSGMHSLFVVVDDTNSLKEAQSDNDAFIRAFEALPPLSPEQIQHTTTVLSTVSMVSTVSTTISQTVVPPPPAVETSTFTTTSFMTITSTVTQTQASTAITTTNQGQSSNDNMNNVYGGLLVLVAVTLLVAFAVAKGAQAVKALDR